MPTYKTKAVIVIHFNSDEYHVPADFNLKETLQEDIAEAVESNLSVEVEEVTITSLRKEQNE